MSHTPARKLKVSIYGDSHTTYFGASRQLVGYRPSVQSYELNLNVEHGAAIAGFGKRRSTKNVKEKILNGLSLNKPDYLVLNFGQVDLELGLFFRKFVKLENKSFSQHVATILETYSIFLADLPIDNNQIIVKGVNLPTLCYSREKWLDYIKRIITENISSITDVTQVEENMAASYLNDQYRTSMASYFNGELRKMVQSNCINYFDINAEIEDKNTGLIKTDYIPCRDDHHILDSVGIRALHWAKLEDIIIMKENKKELF